MLVNTQSGQTWPTIDHHGYQDNLGGYHTIIHQDTAARTIDRTLPPGAGGDPIGFPGAIGGINQLFAALVNTPTGNDTQIFNKTGNGGLSQLTGDVAATEGYQWIGGILLQWGTILAPVLIAGIITFKDPARTGCIDFPNNLFGVFFTPFVNAGVPSNRTIGISTPTTDKTQFTYALSSAGPNWAGVYWFAIGN